MSLIKLTKLQYGLYQQMTFPQKKLFEELDPIFGSVIATNKKEDLAIIKVGNFPDEIEPVKVGSIKEVQVGDKVFAIGHPEGLPWTFSEGIINQIRKKELDLSKKQLQTFSNSHSNSNTHQPRKFRWTIVLCFRKFNWY